MQPFSYEDIPFKPGIPVIYHEDTLYKNNCAFIPHWHEHPEILLVKSGWGVVKADNACFEIDEGDIAVVNSSEIHIVEPSTDIILYHCLIIDRDFCEKCGVDLKMKAPCLIKRGTAKFKKCAEYYSGAAGAYSASCGRRAELIGNAALLLAELYSDAQPARNLRSEKERAVLKAMKYISMHYGERLSLDKVAAELGISKYHFCRIFKEVSGKTFTEYLNYVRCASAREMMANQKSDVSNAAFACGFSSLSYFTKTFKRIMGTLPSMDMRD